MRRTVSSTAALMLLVGAAAASASTGTPAREKLFARQDGCGATAEAGRLEKKAGTTDGADGCGVLGGLPLSDTVGAEPISFTTLENYKKVLLTTGKVTGQVAAGSWNGVTGGVGTVVIDVAVTGQDAAGDTVEIGSTTVSAPAAPTATTVKIPFELSVPAESAGRTVVGWTMSVTLRGQNVNANAQALNGAVFVDLPIVK